MAFFTKVVDQVVGVVDNVGRVADSLANVPPGDVKNEVGLILAAASTFGVLHVSNAPAVVNAVTGLVFAVAAFAVALERVVKSLKG